MIKKLIAIFNIRLIGLPIKIRELKISLFKKPTIRLKARGFLENLMHEIFCAVTSDKLDKLLVLAAFVDVA